MLNRFVRRVYQRLGPRYRYVFPLAQDPAALGIATVAVLLVSSYYDPSGGEVLAMLAAVWCSTAVAVLVSFWRGRRYMELVLAWQNADSPSPEESIAAWDAATNFPVRSFKANVLVVNAVAAVPAVAAVMAGDDGTDALAKSIAVAVGVGLLLSFELTVLLSRSITAPIAALRRGLAEVREDDYDVRVPVVTSDELGELSHDFNLMAVGLEEREKMREAFGTYLDRDIVPFILSGRFPQEGVEVTVSIMFVDVRDFTPFAERSEATEVVATLNALFEVIVPIA